MEENLVVDQKDAQDNKIMAILAYLGILFLVPYLAAKESPFARFHANQGCVLFIVEIATWALISILAFVPGFRWLSLLLSLLYFVFFAFAIIGIINVTKGEMKELPVIGKYRILK